MENKIDLVEITIAVVFVLAAVVIPTFVAFSSHGFMAAVIAAVFHTAFWAVILRATGK